MSELAQLFKGREDLLSNLPALDETNLRVIKGLEPHGISLSTLDLQVGQLECAVTLSIVDHLNTASAFGFDTSRILNVARRVHQSELAALPNSSALERPLGESNVESQEQPHEEARTNAGTDADTTREAIPIPLSSR